MKTTIAPNPHARRSVRPRLAIVAQRAMASLAIALAVLPAKAFDLDPQLIGRWPGYFRGPALGVAISGNLAYVAAGGMQVIDVTNPRAPRRVGWFNLSEAQQINKVSVSGSFAYVLDISALHVVDVSAPAKPTEVGKVNAGITYNLAVAEQHLYLAKGQQGLQIIDVSNPVRPRRVNAVKTAGDATDVAADSARRPWRAMAGLEDLGRGFLRRRLMTRSRAPLRRSGRVCPDDGLT
jgi:hypothetical protein